MNAAAATTTTITVQLIKMIHLKRDNGCNGNERNTRERTTGWKSERFKIKYSLLKVLFTDSGRRGIKKKRKKKRRKKGTTPSKLNLYIK